MEQEKCETCGSNRLVNVCGKISDFFWVQQKNTGCEYEGYVPSGMNIGIEDYIEFDYCLNCGKIQGTFPVKNLPTS